MRKNEIKIAAAMLIAAGDAACSHETAYPGLTAHGVCELADELVEEMGKRGWIEKEVQS